MSTIKGCVKVTRLKRVWLEGELHEVCNTAMERAYDSSGSDGTSCRTSVVKMYPWFSGEGFEAHDVTKGACNGFVGNVEARPRGFPSGS